MAKLTISRDEYRDKVLACWMGKNIGGTLGAPFEWRRQLNQVSFYTHELNGEPIPNDDLDLQLLWLVALEEQGLDLDRSTLSEYWMLYLTPHWMEYGTSKANLRLGLLPPHSGTCNNVFRHSCGAFIRSEIWACLAPGIPEVAARYAREDAIIDHGNGEGTCGEIFFAALESAAFVVSDLRKLITIGLSYIPKDCAVRAAVELTLRKFDEGALWHETRDALLADYRGAVFNYVGPASAEDIAKGFGDGRLGFDAPANVAITILGLLHGGSDFGKVICTAVNCGEDTDCTAATAGSIFGLMYGTKEIPKRWLDPIGRTLKTCCLNLGDLPAGRLPLTVDELTERTEKLATRFLLRPEYQDRVAFTSEPSPRLAPEAFDTLAWPGNVPFVSNPCATEHRFDFFDISVDAGESPFIRSGHSKSLRISIRNLYRMQANLVLKWYLPAGWSVSPSDRGSLFLFSGSEENVTFNLQADKVEPVNRGVLEVTIPGRPTTMLAPILLLGGDLVPDREVA